MYILSREMPNGKLVYLHDDDSWHLDKQNARMFNTRQSAWTYARKIGQLHPSVKSHKIRD